MECSSPTFRDAKSGIDIVIHNSVRDGWLMNKLAEEWTDREALAQRDDGAAPECLPKNSVDIRQR